MTWLCIKKLAVPLPLSNQMWHLLSPTKHNSKIRMKTPPIICPLLRQNTLFLIIPQVQKLDDHPYENTQSWLELMTTPPRPSIYTRQPVIVSLRSINNFKHSKKISIRAQHISCKLWHTAIHIYSAARSFTIEERLIDRTAKMETPFHKKASVFDIG